MLVARIKTFVSTKAELLDEKVNDFIATLPDDSYDISAPCISYTCINGKGAYMICCTVCYQEEIKDPE